VFSTIGEKLWQVNIMIAPGTKRRILTRDDLLRRQEEPHRKRVKLSPPPIISDGWETGSDASGSSTGEVQRRSTGGDDDSEESEDEDEENLSGKETEELEEDIIKSDGREAGDEDLLWDNPKNSLKEPERFSFSRVKARQISPQISEKKLPDSFLALGISPQLQSALTTMSIRTPTEVQAACIPPLLTGK
jgi:ATP-dependent RNA helicase DDX49/DBP8